MIKTTGIAKIDALNVKQAKETEKGTQYQIRLKVDLEVDDIGQAGLTDYEQEAARGMLAASLAESDGGDATKAATYKLSLRRGHPPAYYRVNGNAADFLATPHGAPVFKASQGVATLTFTLDATVDDRTLLTLASFVRESPVEWLAGSVQLDLLESAAAASASPSN